MSHITEPIGLGPEEDRVYLTLLELGRTDAARLADRLRLHPDAVAAALTELARLGLVHRDAFGAPRFYAVSPDVGLPELIRQRRRQLHELQLEVERLYASGEHAEDHLILRIASEDAVIDAVTAAQRTARAEVLMIDAPPYFEGGGQPNDPEFVGLAAGIAYRAIYHAAAVATADDRDALQSYLDAGEEARLHASVGPKMLIVDHSVAIVVESWTDPDPAQRLLIRSRVVIEMMRAHFERYWESAIPFTGAEPADPGDEAVSSRDRELLALMASGMKDRTIARTLGVTERTVGRRVTELMRRLDADTRFRAGALAYQRGWITLE